MNVHVLKAQFFIRLVLNMLVFVWILVLRKQTLKELILRGYVLQVLILMILILMKHPSNLLVL